MNSFVLNAKPDADEEPIGLIGQAFAALLTSQPALTHFVAALGLVSKILGIMNVDNPHVLRGAITIGTHTQMQRQTQRERERICRHTHRNVGTDMHNGTHERHTLTQAHTHRLTYMRTHIHAYIHTVC
jgi:hypothetical protein